MQKAINLAKVAAQNNEVPIGAVVVKEDEVIGFGYNQVIKLSDPTAHAEILAIKEAAKAIGNYRLSGCDLYVTLSPCPMCYGAILNSRITNVYFGAVSEKYPTKPILNYQGSILKHECAELLKEFFANKR